MAGRRIAYASAWQVIFHFIAEIGCHLPGDTLRDVLEYRLRGSKKRMQTGCRCKHWPSIFKDQCYFVARPEGAGEVSGACLQAGGTVERRVSDKGPRALAYDAGCSNVDAETRKPGGNTVQAVVSRSTVNPRLRRLGYGGLGRSRPSKKRLFQVATS